MKVRYLLKKKGKSKDGQPIYIALYHNDQTELIFTGEKIKVKDWNSNERLPKDHTGDTYTRIEKVRGKVQKIIKLLEAQDKPVTPFTVKQEYQEVQRKRDVDLLAEDGRQKQYIETVNNLVKRWLENDIFMYKASTQKTIKQSLGQFTTFLKVAGLQALQRQHLTPSIIKQFERYLQDKKKLSNSTHGRTMKHLRWFLKTLNYDVGSIAIRNHRKEIIALTLDELQLLEKIDVSNSIEQQKAKDMFLLGCYTGLRISDLKRLNETRIIDRKICMILQKNKKEVSIPLRDEAKRILQKYSMAAPKISEQQLNESIKTVCDRAGVNRLLTIKKNVGGKDIEIVKPKHQLITSHTASKTFITLAPRRFNMTPPEIAAIVGKDLKTLINHYFQLPLEMAIQKMEKEDAE
jgi:integrase